MTTKSPSKWLSPLPTLGSGKVCLYDDYKIFFLKSFTDQMWFSVQLLYIYYYRSYINICVLVYFVSEC